MPASLSTVDQAAKVITCGVFAPGDGAAHALVATTKPCKRVFISAPVNNDGLAVNSSLVYFGDANRQQDWIAADGSRDRYIHIDDASHLFLKLVNSADTIEYRIEA